MSRHLLVVAYLFPPWGGGGVQRTLGFVRHLDPLGWRCTVITAGSDASYWAQDPSLLEQLPTSTQVLRVKRRGVGRLLHRVRNAPIGPLRQGFDALLSWPDREISWLSAARAEARRCMREDPVDAVYSTGGPWTDHLVPLNWSGRPQPWIADFRDPWTDNALAKFPTAAHRKLMRALERRVHQAADIRLVTSEETKAQMQRNFPKGGPVVVLSNGFEPSVFSDVGSPKAQPPLKMTFTGSFYPGHQPERLYESLAKLIDADPSWRERIELHFYGKTNQQEALIRYGLQGIATEHGYVSQAEAVDAQARSHINWLVLPTEPSPTPFVPQKLYSYLRLNRPILVSLPPGQAQRILSDAGGVSFNIETNPSTEALEAWLRDRLAQPAEPAGFSPEVVGRYDRQQLAGQLAALLDS